MKELSIPVRILFWVGPIIFAVGTVYGLVRDMPEVKAQVAVHETRISVLENHISYIRSGVDEIKRAVKK